MTNLTKEEQNLINKLNETFELSNQPKITQKRFDVIIDELIKADKRETMWRLCGLYEGYNFNKVIDYYIENRDSYYIEELISFVDGILDQEYLVKKLIETNDKEFINTCLELCGKSMQYCIKDKLLEQLLDYLKS